MAEAARNRYQQSFSSQIFEPNKSADNAAFVPAGKRRDQTTSEMFGNYNDKELHAMPKTFEPRHDNQNARQKKMAFLNSEVLPSTGYAYTGRQGGPAPGPQIGQMMMDADTEETIDPNLRRQQELSSELFGRGTPAIGADQGNTRLTPNDFKWFNIPEPVQKGDQQNASGKAVTHQDRSYNEKCSRMFDRASPENVARHGPSEEEQQQRDDESLGDLKRRQNAYYSDLFGRNTPMDLAENEDAQGGGRYRPKHQAHPEDRMVIHQDWTDSKTELMSGRQRTVRTPNGRKEDELHQARIFGEAGTGGYKPPEILEPTHHDNSNKLKSTIGQHTQSIHQAHLRSSSTPDDFYDDAYNTKDWEVVELHISGLPQHFDETHMKRQCQGHDLQIIKVSVETDPVGNYCKGRAKVMVRYNPKRDSINGLVDKLEAANLRVEL